jgi:hypothetical protein
VNQSEKSLKYHLQDVNSDETLAVRSKVVGGFAEEVIEILNHGMLLQMISVSHMTGLFDAMSGLRPSFNKRRNCKGG